jgi:uncharacterized membrane protein HdeD (DUF308 family)
MLTSYAGCWGSFVLRGLALALFGVVALAAPQAAPDLVVTMLGVVLLVSAANATSVGLRSRSLSSQWWLLLVEGALAAVIGVAAFLRPTQATLTPVIFLAVLAALNGLLQLVLAWRGRRGPHRAWPIASAGLLSLGFALLLLWQPLLAERATAAAVALYATGLGVALALTGLRLRRLGRLARRELLRDTPLAQPGAQRPVGTRGWHAV